MLYTSLKDKNHKINFEKAIIKGLPPDKTLYIPNKVPIIEKKWINNIEKYSKNEIALKIIKPYIEKEISKNKLISILNKTLNFSLPIKKIHDNIFTLELFHGPTLAFKDIGAKFMSGCLEYFYKKNKKPITVLVATSGDTGGAVIKAFHNIKGINVIVLFPSGMVTGIQKKQLTTLTGNVVAIEIKGTFDDCQKIVKKVFLDKSLHKKKIFTSANSINIARWLPQMFYYFYAYKQIKKFNKKIIISVPSGNFGNICAAMLANLMGLPICHFIASTNVNDTIPRFLKTGKYIPKKTIKTISNAMDVSNPSNFIRIMNLYKNNITNIKKKLSSYSFNDKETLKNIKKVFKKYRYILDPHGAIGYMGIKNYFKNIEKKNKIGIFLETAHPIKFIKKMPNITKKYIIMPKNIKNILNKSNKYIILSNKYKEFKNWLLKNN